MRTFDTGATRDTDTTKLDFEGFFSPLALEAFAKYMNYNRDLPDGSRRASDNWQLGIPEEAYMKSMFRHLFDVWQNHRGVEANEPMVVALCALMFNVQGMLHEYVMENPGELEALLEAMDKSRRAKWAEANPVPVPVEVRADYKPGGLRYEPELPYVK